MAARRFSTFVGMMITTAAVSATVIYRIASAAPAVIGDLPADLPGASIQFAGADGATLRGWYVPSHPSRGTVIVMHGVKSNRSQMLPRARFLQRAGYSVLLYDSRAHGESGGRTITFGRLESQDASAAVTFAQHTTPSDAHIYVIGVSLGGAASLLAEPPLPVNALVLESVFPTIQEAISDRLTQRLGPAETLATPILVAMIRPRIGFPADDLRPIAAVHSVTAPKLFIFGTADRSTTIAESWRLFQTAPEPKQAWAIEGAAHVDLYRFAGQSYEARILSFLKSY
jgi:fermentation-respiration switch protein FrsA (DUF1100 family)